MSKRLLLSAALAAAALVGPVSNASAELNTKMGYRELGGRISVDFENNMPHLQGADSTSGGHFYLAPQFGYFMMDGLELITDFELGIGFGDLYGKTDTQVGFDLGIRYVISMAAPVRPYIGFQIGMDFHVPEDSKAKTTKDFNLTVPLGILVPLFNDYVAADLGLRFQYRISLEGDAGIDQILVPIGYLGVAAFW